MERLTENPIVRPSDVAPSREDYEVVGAFNAGVARFGNEVLLLLRCAERPKERPDDTCVAPIWNAETGEIELFTVKRDDPDVLVEDERVFRHRGDFYLTSISHLRLARSVDGVHFTVDDAPAMSPETPTEAFGLEDPRITQIGSDYWITYKAVSSMGITTALAHTTDFRTFTRHGIIFCPENLDVVIFPRKFGRAAERCGAAAPGCDDVKTHGRGRPCHIRDGGRTGAGHYVAWTRPVGKHLGAPSIWLARSPDLIHWGAHAPVLLPRPGMWDSARVGASTVPFLTADGWVEIYHGADENNVYCMGVALISRDDPAKVLARSAKPLMRPETDYEREGFFGGVVFSCGADVQSDGTVTVYYGASDETTCAATTTVDELLHSVTAS